MSQKISKSPRSYLVFARKFRPQVFDEIVGQETIVSTLKNAILQGKVPQSFLFTGTRGVGKTSTARILAKSLNCEKGPTVSPCGKCVSCSEITAGNSLDVIEIDGASNNSVDNIRDLRESIALSPVHGRFKIYIIDEVHMLSGGAFNALLKTLEEPPLHSKFIFATTDAHKIPATILSRCQRFQFRRLPLADITAKLTEIAGLEKIEAEPEALTLIAKAAEGSLRDAESLLDQLANFSKSKIKTAEVEKALGLASSDIYLSLLRAWGKKDAPEALEILERALEGGLEMLPFTKGLYEMTRNFLMVLVHPNPKGLIDLSPEMVKEIAEEAKAFTEEGLLSILAGLERLIPIVQHSPGARFALEAAAIRFASVSDTANLAELLKRLERLERRSQVRVVADSPSALYEKTPASNTTNAPATSISPKPTAPIPGPGQKVFFTIDQVEAIWPQVIQEVEKGKMSLGPALRESEPISTEDGCLILGFPAAFKYHKETLEQNEARTMIEKALSKCLGSPLAVKTVLTQPEVSQVPRETAAGSAPPGEVPPIVESALSDIFKGGRIIRRD